MADELTIDLSLAGKSLVGLGRAKCRVAAMQASFLDELQETYLAGLGEDCKSLLRSASKLRSTAPFQTVPSSRRRTTRLCGRSWTLAGKPSTDPLTTL